MVIEFPLIFTTQYVNQALRWLEAIGRGESASVIFFPKADRFIRIGQLLNDKRLLRRGLGHRAHYMFQQINFDAHDAEDKDDLCHQITEHLNLSQMAGKFLSFEQWASYFKKHKVTLVLVLVEAERFTKPETKHVLSLFTDVLNTFAPHIQMLSLFETDITHPELAPLLPGPDRLYENIYRYPLYPEEHTRAFIRLLANQWHITIHRKIEDNIIAACGGHFWLVKEAVREIAVKGRWSAGEEGMVFRLRLVFDGLIPSEQRVVEKLVTNQKNFSPEERHSFMHFKHMRAADSRGRWLLGAYKHFLLHREEKVSKLALKNNRIVLNDVPLDTLFSRKEHRVLALLLERRGTVISRDQLAQRIWPTQTEEHYSDWAIDQLIARLRKRLLGLALPTELIRAVRGKGYRVQL